MEIDLNGSSLSTSLKEHGFRVRVEICYPESVKKKYFIFLNKNEWSEISHVMCHIQKLFAITDDIEVYVDDTLLPRKETINLIERNDTLIVRVLNQEKRNQQINTSQQIKIENSFTLQSLHENKPKKKSLKRVSVENDITQEISECIEELNRKKKNILKSYPDAVCTNNDVTTEFDDINSSNDNSSLLLDNSCLSPKKKRKRKHKKRIQIKNDHEDNLMEETSSVYNNTELNCEEISTNLVGNNSSSQKHIYFSEAGDETNEMSVTSNIKNEVTNDILSKLKGLASKPKYEKVFSRKKEQANKAEPKFEEESSAIVSSETGKLLTPERNESTSSCVIESPNVGDIISFTKIKIGNNYCPELSGTIVGKVIRIHMAPDNPNIKRIGLEILQGSEEFEMPEGKFSLDQENVIQTNIPQIHLVELNWHELLEPRLYKSKIPL